MPVALEVHICTFLLLLLSENQTIVCPLMKVVNCYNLVYTQAVTTELMLQDKCPLLLEGKLIICSYPNGTRWQTPMELPGSSRSLMKQLIFSITSIQNGIGYYCALLLLFYLICLMPVKLQLNQSNTKPKGQNTVPTTCILYFAAIFVCQKCRWISISAYTMIFWRNRGIYVWSFQNSQQEGFSRKITYNSFKQRTRGLIYFFFPFQFTNSGI